MKKSFLITACLLMMLTVVAQQVPQDNSTHKFTREEYLKKSKGQKTAAIVLLAGGGALLTVGSILTLNDPVYYFDLEDNSNEDVEAALILVGGVAMLSSIPFFIASRKNKARAMQVSVKNEMALQLQKGTMFHKSIPSLNLKINF